MPQNDVFISYSRKDAKFAERIVDDLNKFGISTWSDTQIEPGEDWQKTIETNLFQSKYIVFFLSSSSVNSNWTLREIEIAISKSIKVIPLLIEEINQDKIPNALRNIQWIDFTGDYGVALTKLFAFLSEQKKSSAPIEQKPVLNKGYVFLSFTEEDMEFVVDLKDFLKTKGYAYWDYTESDRDYHNQFVLELEQAITDAKATLSIISENWKKSSWTVKEYIFSTEVGTPVFLLKSKQMGPTLIIAGVNFIDFTLQKDLGFKKLEKELNKKGL